MEEKKGEWELIKNRGKREREWKERDKRNKDILSIGAKQLTKEKIRKGKINEANKKQ